MQETNGEGAAGTAVGRVGRGRSGGLDTLLVFLATTTVCLLGLLAAIRLRPDWFGLQPSTASAPEPGLAPRPNEPSDPLADLEPRPIVSRDPSEPTEAQRIFADASPSVVHVTTRSRRNRRPTADEFISGTGSGLIWDERGHIVTCKHVVDTATSAFVTLSDGTEWEAKLVGLDDASDLAVVRIDAPEGALMPIRVGTSADLRAGMRVYSVACPYGIGHSLSVGYVSGLDRRIRSRSGKFLDGTVQTDAALHPGSSGGALIDDQGRVIGLNAAIHADSRRQVGVGFAHPIDRLQEVVPSIILNGFRWEPRYGFVTASDAGSENLLDAIGDQGIDAPAGVVVAEVIEGGPAAAAGLRSMQTTVCANGTEVLVVRDVVVGVGGARIESRGDLSRSLAALDGDDPLVLTIARRDGEVEVVIEPAPTID
ncbi:MAG: trypsin-like peptidase domain-containing protein [Planctomycetota bacterium]